jgi:hypothetical protein
VASHPLPIPVPTVKERAQSQASLPHIPIWAVVAVLSALLILFGWLHLILSLEISSTGREIQQKTRELERLERARAAILLQIADAESPEALESRIQPGTYKAQTPLYLAVEPLPLGNGLSVEPETGLALAADTESQMTASQSRSLIDSVLARLDSWIDPAASP